MYEVDQELRGGELSLSSCLGGVGSRPPRKKKIANPRAGLQPLFSILRGFLGTEIIDKNFRTSSSDL